MLKITKATVEYRIAPLGVENDHPRFGWQTSCDQRNFAQESYSIVVKEGEKEVWNSGKVKSSVSDNIVYEGEALRPATIYNVHITVFGANGEEASLDTRFETALKNENFTAKWIGQAAPRADWAPYFRKEFTVGKNLSRARLYVSGMGYGEAWLNGARVTDNVLEPMNTNYEKIVDYSAYDITAQLKEGENAVGVIVGCGFFNQDRVWWGGLHYGAVRLLAELHLWYEDGKHETVVTDESWLCDYSPITLNNVHDGETYDARLEQPGWCTVGFDARRWENAIEMPAPGGVLTCRQMPPIKRYRRVMPKSIRQLHEDTVKAYGGDDQTWIVDMGENFAGWLKLNLPQAPAGSECVLRFAERLIDGSLDYSTCGARHAMALQQDRYISAGKPGGEVFEPRFCYHGFRYVEITGVYNVELPENMIEGYAVNTDLEENGNIQTDYEPINKLQELGYKTILSNFHGYPEDCPVREKCGWLGDAQLVSEVAIQNFDMATSYEKYMEDIRTSREVYGTWQMIAPGKRTCGDATPLWGSAQVVIPWMMYLYYGDKAMLEKYYTEMMDWVEHEKADSKDYIITRGLGDWNPPGGNEHPERIPVPVSSTAEFFHVAVLMEKIAKVLGKEDDASAMAALAEKIKEAFNREFLDKEAPSYRTMGADGVALAYGLCPEELREDVAKDCVKIIEERNGGGFHTGIFGNKYMVPALTEMGLGDAMMETLFHEEKPSFMVMMKEGAGSVWEEFPRGDVEFLRKAGEGSQNHPMHFAFASWFYTHLLGLNVLEDAPAYRRFLVKPYVLQKVRAVSGTRKTSYGEIKVDWKAKDGKFSMEITVPSNTQADFCLPMSEKSKAQTLSVTTDGENLTVAAKECENRICFTLGSGSYSICYTY